MGHRGSGLVLLSLYLVVLLSRAVSTPLIDDVESRLVMTANARFVLYVDGELQVDSRCFFPDSPRCNWRSAQAYLFPNLFAGALIAVQIESSDSASFGPALLASLSHSFGDGTGGHLCAVTSPSWQCTATPPLNCDWYDPECDAASWPNAISQTTSSLQSVNGISASAQWISAKTMPTSTSPNQTLSIYCRYQLPESSQCPPPKLSPALRTDSVEYDPDDPAVWIHPTDPTKSVIVCTDKKAVYGSLFAFDIVTGKTIDRTPALDRPNNVDVISLESSRYQNIVVLTERKQERLRIFTIDPSSRKLIDITGDSTLVLQHRNKTEVDIRAPMGISLFVNRKTTPERVFAIVSPKTGPPEGYMTVYELIIGEKVNAVFVQDFGFFAGGWKGSEIEAITARDPDWPIFYADENDGIRWAKMNGEGRIVGEAADWMGGEDQYIGDREGLAMTEMDGKRYLWSSDQIPGRKTRLHVYEIIKDEVKSWNIQRIAIVTTVSDETDGLEVSMTRIGNVWPEGILVMMNSMDKNLLVYDMRDVKKRLHPVLPPEEEVYSSANRVMNTLFL